MSQHNNNIYLGHILESIQKIEDYFGNCSFDNFKEDSKTIDAIVRNFEVIGEASNKISEEFKELHQEINFRPIVSMRNWLIHGYDDVDLKIVWRTIKEDLPELKEQIKKILNNN